jgi:glycosyltransferase involved in cell wall biosynthesis
MAIRHLAGRREELARFDAKQFKDFVWRALFARTLHAGDFDTVTNANFRIARVPWSAMHSCALITRKLGYALYPRLDTSGFDVMIAETPYPGMVSSRTKLVVRYHDAIPVLMPHTISDREYHQASHYHALRKNVSSGAFFACVSESTRNDLLSLFPEAASRSVTIHNMVSPHYYLEDSSAARVPEIIKTRLNGSLGKQCNLAKGLESVEGGQETLGYLLVVSTIEPRKNHATLLAAWENLRAEKYPHLMLVIVGMLGWDHKAIVKKFLPWMERGQLFVLEDVPSPELRVLYKHALATVCPSFGEGFDFSGVEAMRCGGAVVASRIPVHNEIYGDAAEYFSPYSTAELVTALETVIDPTQRGRRDELVSRGASVSAQYVPEKILPKWQEFLVSQLVTMD